MSVTLSLTIVFLLAGSVVSMVMLSSPERVYACEVGGDMAFDRATELSVAIFSGTVVDIERFAVDESSELHAVFFAVDRYWKSPNPNENDVDYYKELVVFTGTSGNVCGYEFETGKEYLVYAVPWWQGSDSLYTGLGYRNQPIKNAQEDLTVLGKGMVPTKQVSWEDQISRAAIKAEPPRDDTTNIISIIGIGGAVAGVLAFFSLRRLKDKR